MPFIGNLSFWEIALLLVAVLLLFGAKRLPEIGASMGKGIREFKKSLTDMNRSLNEPDRDQRADSLPQSDAAPQVTEEEKRPEPKRLLS